LARPRSEDKRKAILKAAAGVFAERGIADAPTSAIARAAGVADGTLFTYFESKSELMDALYLDLRQRIGQALAEVADDADPRVWLRAIWERYLRLGADHRDWMRVLAQLRAAGRLFKEDEPEHPAILGVVDAVCRAADSDLHGLSAEYMVLALRAQAEATIEYIHAHPEQAENCRELGFRMLWRGLRGNRAFAD